jgi:hypothetical protein
MIRLFIDVLTFGPVPRTEDADDFIPVGEAYGQYSAAMPAVAVVADFLRR